MKGHVNNALPKPQAFKRAPSLGLSQWENGNLTTNLAEKQDTDGAFFQEEAMLPPGTQPPPHAHCREKDPFNVLKEDLDGYVGKDPFRGEAGECELPPTFKP